MAFSLKNAEVTYLRMVNKVFSTQIGRNMEIYVDDMLIKSREAEDHEANLWESFENMRRNKLWLNPDNQKNAQRLIGKIAALTWFTSRTRDQSLPFFKAIKKGKELDLAVSQYALSRVLIREEDKVQRLVYYVSRVMRGAETMSSQTNSVEVITDQPLQQILENPSRSGWILKWAIELNEFDLRYRLRTSIKAQAIADFMVECTHGPEEAASELISLIEASQKRV
ncbi:hypothetical protein LIER_17474 [Lithospermum erythrorhizon]|uniref:Reverse transcriptase domain-containing protein n=1 Tax=Lithospermum erythrorhizon TaxID=34254 RepID=A0AAV3QC28_LITER